MKPPTNATPSQPVTGLKATWSAGATTTDCTGTVCPTDGNAAGLPTQAYGDMRGIQWGKLLVNLNNSINALSGLPLRQQLQHRGYRKVMAACVREGLRVLKRAGIKPKIDAPLPPSLMPTLMELPNAIFNVAAKKIVAIDPNARSSMWEDLQRGRRTEVDLLKASLKQTLEKAMAIKRQLEAKTGLKFTFTKTGHFVLEM